MALSPVVENFKKEAQEFIENNDFYRMDEYGDILKFLSNRKG